MDFVKSEEDDDLAILDIFGMEGNVYMNWLQLLAVAPHSFFLNISEPLPLTVFWLASFSIDFTICSWFVSKIDVIGFFMRTDVVEMKLI